MELYLVFMGQCSKQNAKKERGQGFIQMRVKPSLILSHALSEGPNILRERDKGSVSI